MNRKLSVQSTHADTQDLRKRSMASLASRPGTSSQGRRKSLILKEKYIPLASADTMIKDFTTNQKLDVITPLYDFEQEEGDQIMSVKAALNYFTVRQRQYQIRKKPQNQGKHRKIAEQDYLAMKSYDRTGVQLGDGQVAGLFARTFKYKYTRGSMHGPGEPIVNMPFFKPKESRNAFRFRNRPVTNYDSKTPGPGHYEMESEEAKIKDNKNSFSFTRTKRVGPTGEELCSPGDMKKREGGSISRVSTTSGTRRQKGFRFTKTDRGLGEIKFGYTDMGPGYYRYADKAYQNYLDSSAKFTFSKNTRDISESVVKLKDPEEEGVIIGILEDKLNREHREASQSSNFQRFSQLDRFNIDNSRKHRLESRLAKSCAKIAVKRRLSATSSIIHRNIVTVVDSSPRRSDSLAAHRKSRTNIRRAIAQTASLEVEASRKERILRNQWMRESVKSDNRESELSLINANYLQFNTVVAMCHAIGQVFKSRYNTHKRCLQFLRRCYYICRMIGKAKIWQRRCRIRKASKILTFFIKNRVKPWLARRNKRRKQKVVKFVKIFSQSTKFFISVSKLVRAIRLLQSWYKRRKLYYSFLEAMANFAWQMNEEEVINKINFSQKNLKKRTKIKVDDLEDCEKQIPLHIRFLFMKIFMKLRRYRHFTATKLWQKECEQLKMEREKKYKSSKRLKLSELLKRDTDESFFPPKPVISSFLDKREICEMIRVAYLSKHIWNEANIDKLVIRRLENFVSDQRMSLTKKRPPLVAGMGKEGRKFAADVLLARKKYMRLSKDGSSMSGISAISSEEDKAKLAERMKVKKKKKSKLATAK